MLDICKVLIYIICVIRWFTNKVLERFFATGDGRRLSVQNTRRIANILRALDDASRPEDMNLPGFRFHALVGRDRGRYAVNASGNWRITFGWLDGDAIDVDRKIITEEDSMTKKLPKRGLPPMHPGELLREEILPALDRPKTEIAKLLGVSRQTLYDILDEKQPVTPTMALRLGKLCGNGPDLWLNLQKRYDLQRAEQELGEKINAIPTLEVA
jgi:addiction module HigA family antidote